jgi:hypothetical protein
MKNGSARRNDAIGPGGESIELTWPGCPRGNENDRPVLHLRRGWQGSASLLLWDAEGKPHWVLIKSRLTRLLLVLARAWEEDRHLPGQFQGFRSAEQIAAQMQNFTGNPGRLSGNAVRRYVYLVRMEIRKSQIESTHVARYGAKKGGLIETERKVGYRIGPCGMEVVVVDPNGQPPAYPA